MGKVVAGAGYRVVARQAQWRRQVVVRVYKGGHNVHGTQGYKSICHRLRGGPVKNAGT